MPMMLRGTTISGSQCLFSSQVVLEFELNKKRFEDHSHLFRKSPRIIYPIKNPPPKSHTILDVLFLMKSIHLMFYRIQIVYIVSLYVA